MTTRPKTTGHAVAVWLDPVCPFSWNTARWLRDAAATLGFDIDWQLTSLAILNEGRELPPPMQARMADSRTIGRLMAAIAREKGPAGLSTAYFTFGERYFAHSPGVVDDELVRDVLASADARDTTADAVTDSSLDELLQQSHAAGQSALGETGGSPIVSIDGRAFFGPVLTSVPPQQDSEGIFQAVAMLAATASFSQLQRPRPAHT